MSQKTDWYPSSRADQINMIRNWISILSVAETRTKWGIPADKFTELGNRFAAAQALLQKAVSEETRTPVVTEQCREAFGALEETARFFHRHYFLVPPLEPADLVRMGLKVPSPPSPIPRPENQVEADLVFPGIHLKYRFRLAEPPQTGRDLPYSLFTRRKKERFDFDGESGSRVYFCLRYENPKGREEGQGPFGPILSAVIP